MYRLVIKEGSRRYDQTLNMQIDLLSFISEPDIIRLRAGLLLLTNEVQRAGEFVSYSVQIRVFDCGHLFIIMLLLKLCLYDLILSSFDTKHVMGSTKAKNSEGIVPVIPPVNSHVDLFQTCYEIR